MSTVDRPPGQQADPPPSPPPSAVVTRPPPPPPAPPARRRIGGVDAARAIAIVGMVMVHFGPFPVVVDDPLSFAYRTSYGRASILFAVLAGVGVSLLTGDRSRERVRDTRRRLGFRAAVLFPLGLALQALPTRVAVILQYYAVYFLIAAAAARLRDRWLLGLALCLVAVAPVVLVAVSMAEPAWFEGGGNVTIGEPVRLLRALTLTGYYPALTWAPVVLWGMWVGRRDLRAPRVRRRLLVGGVTVAAAAYLGSAALLRWLGAPPEGVADWRQLALSEGHSEMPLAIVGATAVATAILGAALILVDRLPRLSWPLVATGQLALTIYVGHLFVLAATPETLERATVEAAAGSVARFAVVVVTAATLWRAVLPRGPVEALLALPFTLARRRT